MADNGFTSNDFKFLGGKTRRYENKKTGETISRRQFDERYGRLKQKEFATPEQQAKINKELNYVEQQKRPARGRKSRLKKIPKFRETKKSKLNPLGLPDFSRTRKPKNSFHKSYTIPYTLEALAWFMQTASKNKKVFCIGIPNILFDSKERPFSPRVMACTALDELPKPIDVWEDAESMIEDTYFGESDPIGFIVSIAYKS